MSLIRFSRLASGKIAAVAFVLLSSSYLAGCGGDGVSQNASYQIGGVVSGLVGTGLVLNDNGEGGLAITKNGAFSFTAALTNGSSYAVTIATEPTSPSQNCIVTSGTGTVDGSNVTSVNVTCTTNGFTIGGQVSGLTGGGLVLQDNAGDVLPITQNGPFTFLDTVGSDVGYDVVVKTQPTNPGQACVVLNGTGTVASANISNVAVECSTTNLTVSGTITGLLGTGLVLQTNGITIPISGNTFSVGLQSGTAYDVMVTTPPTNPTQTCVVANGSGTLTNASVTNVTVTCATTQSYTVGGPITGVTGTGLVLQNNGVTIPFSGNSFSVTLASGSPYNITIAHQPGNPTQACTVSNGGPGTVATANVTVTVNCVTSTYFIKVTVTGLPGAGTTGLTLHDNGGDPLTITANGTTPFATKVASGQPYAVTIATQPSAAPAQYCIVQSGNGTVTNADVTSVSMSCRNVGEALFVANQFNSANGNVAGFTIDPTSGNLSVAAGSPFTADGNPVSIALDVTNQFAYVANFASNDVSTYSISRATAVLTPVGTPGYADSGVQTFSVVVDPASPNYVFVGSDSGGANGYVDFYDSTAGVLSLNGASPIASGSDPLVMAVDPSGRFLFASDKYDDTVNVYSITDGVLANVSNSPFTNGTGSAPLGVAVYPAGGYVYVAGSGNGTLTAYSYDATTGALTLLGAPYPVPVISGVSTPAAVAIDPTGRFLYVTDTTQNAISEYSVAPLTGLLTVVDLPLATGSSPADVKIDPSGHFLYVANTVGNTVNEFTIDPNTGAPALVTSGGTVVSVGAVAIAIE